MDRRALGVQGSQRGGLAGTTPGLCKPVCAGCNGFVLCRSPLEHSLHGIECDLVCVPWWHQNLSSGLWSAGSETAASTTTRPQHLHLDLDLDRAGLEQMDQPGTSYDLRGTRPGGNPSRNPSDLSTLSDTGGAHSKSTPAHCGLQESCQFPFSCLINLPVLILPRHWRGPRPGQGRVEILPLPPNLRTLYCCCRGLEVHACVDRG